MNDSPNNATQSEPLPKRGFSAFPEKPDLGTKYSGSLGLCPAGCKEADRTYDGTGRRVTMVLDFKEYRAEGGRKRQQRPKSLTLSNLQISKVLPKHKASGMTLKNTKLSQEKTKAEELNSHILR